MRSEITIYDLAKQLNLSAATISRALSVNPVRNKNSKKLIVEKAEELSYWWNNFADNLHRWYLVLS